MRFSYERSGFGPTLPAHPFLASSQCQRAEELSSFSQPRTASPRLQNRPRSIGRPAYIKATGSPSTSFFATPRFSPNRPAEQVASANLSHRTVSGGGRLFTLEPDAPSTSFFAPKLFYFGKQSNCPLLYFPPLRRILRLDSEARFLPQGRNPVNRFFRRSGSFLLNTFREAVASSAAPPARSLRPLGRPVSTPLPRPRQTLFLQIVTFLQDRHATVSAADQRSFSVGQ